MSTLIISFIVLAIIIGIAYVVTSHKHEEVTVQVEETPSHLKGGESMHYASSVVIPFGPATTHPTHEIQSRGRVHRTNSVEPAIHHIHEDSDDSGDFATSMLVAEMTDSALLGAAVGGDFVGAMIGEEMAESNRDTDDSNGVYQSPAYEEDQQDNSYTPDTKDDSYSSNDSTSYDSDSSSSSYSSGSDD